MRDSCSPHATGDAHLESTMSALITRIPSLVRLATTLPLVFAALAASTGSVRAQGAIPTPESVFGFPVGADQKLFDYAQSMEYFRKLAASSKSVRIIDVGKTSFGRDWSTVLISSPENLERLDQLRTINMRLAHPAGLTDAEAHTLARQGRAIVDISGGLHASEIAGSQHTPLLAYEILSKANDPAVKEILDNVILFLWPSINPDGQDIVVNSCLGRTPGPMPLYQKYIGHDNNRDSYMLNVVESRVVGRVWREWEPNIIYVHHQSSPEPTRIWLPPFADPVGIHAPPIPAREINTIGMAIAQELDSRGQPGAVHMLATFDAWYPGYIDYMPVYQNIPSFWTETQGGNCATPKPASNPANFGATYRDLRPQPLYLSPWEGATWRLRDAVDYMVTASFATLKYAAKYKEDLLYNRYQSGRNTILKYRNSAPYAYFIPQAQHDPFAPVELLRRMAFLGIRVSQADRDITHDGVTYPKGTWVIPMDQEFAELARTLFEPQKYPQIGDDTPYDAAGWTLPYQMNVNVIEAKSALSADTRAALKVVEGRAVDWKTAPDAPFTMSAAAAGIVPPAGGITGRGDVVLLDPAQNNAFRLINRALADGASLRFSPANGSQGARYVLSGSTASKIDSWATELFVRGERVARDAFSAALATPTRIGLYKSSANNMDEGWTEWLFDTHDFKYTLISPADLQAGNLAAKYDVIVFGSQNVGGGAGRGGRGGPPAGAGGGRAAGGAAGGAAAAGGRAAGAADSIAAQANNPVAALNEFVRGGGTAVFWNGGSTGAISALQLPVRNVTAGVGRTEFFTGGSIMRVNVDNTHPVMAGMPAMADVMVYNSPVFTTTDGFKGRVLARYPADVSPLRSGYLAGEQLMKGNAAALDVQLDKGSVILFAFQPQWRGQPTGTFRTVFNAAFFARDVSAKYRASPGEPPK